jgi:hypothetical protein
MIHLELVAIEVAIMETVETKGKQLRTRRAIAPCSMCTIGFTRKERTAITDYRQKFELLYEARTLVREKLERSELFGSFQNGKEV